MKNIKQRKMVSEIAFVVYILGMIYLLFFRTRLYGEGGYVDSLMNNFNLKPFDTIDYYLRILKNDELWYLHRTAIINLAGNIIMFVPLGWFLPMMFPRISGFWKFIFSYIAVICGVELLQFVTLLGFCDVDDLILNVVGGLCGYVVLKLVRSTVRFGTKSRVNKDKANKDKI